MKKAAYLLFLIGSTVLVSFQGKAVSYLLFYFALLLPLLALLYSAYVYYRFKIVQDVSHLVVKGEKVPYRLILGNEDFLPFTDITLHFYTDMVRMQHDSSEQKRTISVFSPIRRNRWIRKCTVNTEAPIPLV